MLIIGHNKHDRFNEELSDHRTFETKFIHSHGLAIEVSCLYKSAFKKAYNQRRRFQQLEARGRQNIFIKIYFVIWVFWTDIVLSWNEPNDRGYIAATYFLRIFWHQIETFNVTTVDDSTIRIIFYPRTY